MYSLFISNSYGVVMHEVYTDSGKLKENVWEILFNELEMQGKINPSMTNELTKKINMKIENGEHVNEKISDYLFNISQA